MLDHLETDEGVSLDGAVAAGSFRLENWFATSRSGRRCASAAPDENDS